jgi:hypothetical protein
MRKVILLTILLLSPLMVGFTLRIEPVTTYTDGTPVDVLPVMYDAWVDGVPLATGTTLVAIPLIDNSFGAVHSYKVRARLTDGRVSDNLVATLVSPLDSRLPKAPAAPLSIGN